MTPRWTVAFAGALALSLPRRAGAEPIGTAWLEDVHVEDAGGTETVFRFDHETVDLKASAEGYDELGVALHAGVTQTLTLAPELALRQRGEEPLRLDEVGFRVRWLALNRFAWPALMVYGAYGNDLGDERDHLWLGGAAVHYEMAWFFVNGDVRSELNVGGSKGTGLQTWYGLALGYGQRTAWSWRAGLELFAVVPIVGERWSDPAFGASAESSAYYYGPSFACAAGPFWTALSAVTGYPLSDGASQLMVRGLVGVAH